MCVVQVTRPRLVWTGVGRSAEQDLMCCETHYLHSIESDEAEAKQHTRKQQRFDTIFRTIMINVDTF